MAKNPFLPILIVAGCAVAGPVMKVEEPPARTPVNPEIEGPLWKPPADSAPRLLPNLTEEQRKALSDRREAMAAMLEAIRQRREAIASPNPQGLHDLAALVAANPQSADPAESQKIEALIQRVLDAQEAKRKQLERKEERLENLLESKHDLEKQAKDAEKKNKDQDKDH